MKILIPTAKNITTSSKSFNFEKLNENTKLILNRLTSFSDEELSKIFKITLSKAKVEKQRFLNILNKQAKTYEAIHLFDGLMYKNIQKDLLKTNMKNDIFIVSSLYGIISIWDKISEHRLDFLQKIENINLKEIWKENFDNFIKKDDIVLSLLSSEFEEVFSKKIRDNFFKIVFLEEKNGILRSHSTITKKCRGLFLTKILENKINDIDSLKEISVDSFYFCNKKSKKNIFYFIKKG